MSQISPSFTQGTVEISTNPSDLAIQGDGFFLSLSEKSAYDKDIEDIYAWHPFTGIIHNPNISFAAKWYSLFL